MIMTQALGWALVDSLWQDALAAAGLAALLALVPVRAARIRYAFATLTLALMLALPLATAVRLSGTSPQISDVVTATSLVTPTAPVADRIRAALEPALPWAVLVWFGGVVALSLRLASGWLVPLQLDALLAHELAHVRRYDYLVNLIQSVIETLLFYHPAVWWASQQVREEREHCCDDLAVVVCGDAHLYATALLGMERLRVATPGFALAAAGRGGSLMGRIRRLVAPVQTEIFPRWMAGVIAVTLALGGGAHLATGTAATGDRGGMRTATLDSLIDRVEALGNPAARHEAVKTLGSRRDPRMVPPLLAIAQHDGDEEVQDEAVKALGDVAPPEAALGVLEQLAQRDPDAHVQQEAVEALGHLGSPQALAPLAYLARAQPNAEVRDEAVEQYARSAAPESALVLLVDRLANDSSSDVQEEAVERLADLPDGLGIPALREAARSHPSRHVRAEARRRLEDYR